MAPDTFMPDLQVVQWAPQNDLLGSGRVRAFLTHGGINGLYEVLYYPQVPRVSPQDL